MRKILIVEDEKILRESYELILGTQPYDIFAASNGEEAINLCEKHNFDLILLDLMMPKVNGVEFLEKYRKQFGTPDKVIIMSNLSSGEELEAAMKLGAYKNVLKSNMAPKDLLNMVRYEAEAITS